MKAPVLSELHKEKRLSRATEFVSKTDDDWRKLVSSSEKKFNMNGPAGFKCYWHDLGKAQRSIVIRQRGVAPL